MSANSGKIVGTPSAPHVVLHPKIKILKKITSQTLMNFI